MSILNKQALSEQANNSLNLYCLGKASTIEQLLRLQNPSVVEELMNYCDANNIPELAFILSTRRF